MLEVVSVVLVDLDNFVSFKVWRIGLVSVVLVDLDNFVGFKVWRIGLVA